MSGIGYINCNVVPGSLAHVAMTELIDTPLLVTGIRARTNKQGSIARNVRNVVEASLEMYSNFCRETNYGCDGIHLAWCLAGGYPTYVGGHTTKYNDLDTYVYCSREYIHAFRLCILKYPLSGK